MSLWVIEDLNDAGEGMFVCDAPDRFAALNLYGSLGRHEGMEVTSCEQVQWIDLALMSGKLGESYYYERQRKTMLPLRKRQELDPRARHHAFQGDKERPSDE